MIRVNTRWDPLFSCTLKKARHYSFCLVVRGTFQKYHRSGKSVYPSMNYKAPPNKFVQSINMPERSKSIWPWDIIFIPRVHSPPTKSSIDWVNATNDVSHAMSWNVYISRAKDAFDHSFPAIYKSCFYSCHFVVQDQLQRC